MGDNFATFDQVAAVGDAKDFSDPVVGHQNAYPLISEILDDFLNILDGLRIDAGIGFVQKDQKGIRDKAPGNFQAPFFATGKSCSIVFA